MSDINLLANDDAARDGKAKRPPAAGNEDLTLHVPSQEPPEKQAAPSLGGTFLAQLIDKEQSSVPTEKLFSQKIEPNPATAVPPKKIENPLPKLPQPKPMPPPVIKAVAPPPPPPPPPPSPPGPPKKPPAPPPPPQDDGGKEGGTLRVSLITANGGAGLSDLALRHRQRTFVIIGLIGLLVDALIFGGLHWRKLSVEKKNQEAAQAVQDVDARIAARDAELTPVRDFQALTRAAARVLDAHAHWTEVLKLLEERALPDVQFGSLAGAETGTLGFEIKARDYTTLAKQIVAFRQDARVRKVSVGTASADIGENDLLQGVRASMSLEIDPSIFRYKPQTASAPSVPTTP
ncbi:MAG: hypothetical protein QY323_01575 [Patescibacteria group bacterium]|nr:MAG: hypothetical protein QY323_01575 [Patescibacteria group bacterium]